MIGAVDDLRSRPPLGPQDGDYVRGGQVWPAVIAYMDFTCPQCVVAHGLLRESAELRLIYRHFPLRSRHPRSHALAGALEAAGRQGRFWEMCDSIAADPGHIDDPHIWQRVKQLQLDLERFERDRHSDSVTGRVREQMREGMACGVTATPTLIVGGSLRAGPRDRGELAEVLQAARDVSV
jgi:protein-disulfide isomerase